VTIDNYATFCRLLDDAQLARCSVVIRVYRKLLDRSGIFEVPQDVKAWALALQVKSSPVRVNAALDLLVEHGYVLEHGRGLNNVRRLTVAADRVMRRAS
jgi:hypothetical protein